MSEQFQADLNIIQAAPFEIELLDGDLNIVQQLDDEPNDVGGLTSAELKRKFDEAGLKIQEYINEKLIPAVKGQDSAWAAAEAERAARETARLAAEEERLRAEAERAAAEPLRLAAEAERAAAEPLRISAEAVRQGAEDARRIGEDARQAAEAARVTAEAARNSWEPFDFTKRYEPGNKVFFEGSSYVCVARCQGVYPGDINSAENQSPVSLAADTPFSKGALAESPWQMIAERGAAGNSGGDMFTAVYDKKGRKMDVYQYAEDRLSEVGEAVLLKNEPGGLPAGWADNVVFNRKFRVFAAAAGGYVQISADGVDWTQFALPNLSKNLRTAILVEQTSGKMYVCAEPNGWMGCYSTDGGLTWKMYSVPAGQNMQTSPTYGVACGGGKLVSIGWNGDVNIYTGGADSRRKSAESTGLGDCKWTNLIYFKGKFIAFPSEKGQRIAYSSDGVIWARGGECPLLASKTSAVTDQIAYVTGSSGAICSTDGINWTLVSLPQQIGRSSRVGLTVEAGVLYMAGHTWSAKLDPAPGGTWTVYQGKGFNPAVTENVETSLAYGNGVFVRTFKTVNGQTGGLYTSTDFENWVGGRPTAVYRGGADVAEALRRALQIGRVGILSYIGTGTYGADNPCRVTAAYPIRAAVLLGDGLTVSCMAAEELTAAFAAGRGFAKGGSGYGRRSENGTTLEWYNTGGSAAQLNESGKSYLVMVIA